ncbi:dihydrofolate reductase family protein [Agreia sp. VKM Ac-1783]|uniref:dihydrofolate reductase family protein n=1 Tax=Agreia sp. VKM Ac-1783 TaxID=1938889 RepID=UPI000A2ADFA4|nr:dihydrofolate reductase family protein [Agreia sp. VKM Ac-1783]SMQ68357.1 Dihydrofolate reductase [Agreia sp. VKM Ac-1783]
MGKLIYSMITSLDGYAIDAEGGFDFTEVGEDEHDFFGEQLRSVGTFLYGRRMYETMVFWETAHLLEQAPPFIVDFARVWQAADKVVYSTTLQDVSSERTRIERSFDVAAIRELKSASESDITIDGPHLAAHAVRAGLVDEYQPVLGPKTVGGGTPFFPIGIRLDLRLLDEHRLSSGGLWLRYVPASDAHED